MNTRFNDSRGLNSEETDWTDLIPALESLGLNETLLEAMDYYGYELRSANEIRILMASKSQHSFLVRSENPVNSRVSVSFAVLQRTNNSVPVCQSVIVAATNTEAQQIRDLIGPFAKVMEVKVLLCSNETSIKDDLDSLNDGIHVLIATPGRLFDLISIMAFRIECVDLMTIFEIESLIANGFTKCLEKIYSLLNKTVKVYISANSVAVNDIEAMFPKNFIEFFTDTCNTFEIDDSDIDSPTVSNCEVQTETETEVDRNKRWCADTKDCNASQSNESLECNAKNSFADESETDENSDYAYEEYYSEDPWDIEEDNNGSHEYESSTRTADESSRLIEPCLKGYDYFISDISKPQLADLIALSALKVVNPSVSTCQVLIATAAHSRSARLLKTVQKYQKLTEFNDITSSPTYYWKDSCELRKIKSEAHIVVGTPGTMKHLLRSLSDRKNAPRPLRLKLIILDGIDHMMHYGHYNKGKLLSLLEAMPDNIQILFTGANVTVDSLHFMRTVFQKKLETTLREHIFVVVENEDSKLQTICNILKALDMQTAILCKQSGVNFVMKQMRKRRVSCIKIDESVERKDRLNIMENIRNGMDNRLIIASTTSLLDILPISIVINYDALPSINHFNESQQLKCVQRVVYFHFITSTVDD